MKPPPTLLVIDVQCALDDPSLGARNNPGAERNIAAALAAWREHRAPVIHVRHRNTEPGRRFLAGTPGFEFKPEAMPLPGEPVLTKSVNNAFVGTDLEERLRTDGVQTVAVVGLTTDHCCSTTARMASDLGFETWVLGDAMATHERRAPDGGLLSAEEIHRAELASLSGEFAEVIDTREALERLEASPGRVTTRSR